MATTSEGSINDKRNYVDLYAANAARDTCLFARDLVAGSLYSSIASAKTILDIGCGPGVFCLAYMQHFPEGIEGQTLICSDISKGMVNKAKQVLTAKLPANFKTRILYQVEDSTKLAGVEDESVCVVVSNFGVLQMQHCMQAIRVVHRVLVPGGCFGFTSWSDPQWVPMQFGPSLRSAYYATKEALNGVNSHASSPSGENGSYNSHGTVAAHGNSNGSSHTEKEVTQNNGHESNAASSSPSLTNGGEVRKVDDFRSKCVSYSIHTIVWPNAQALWEMIKCSIGSHNSDKKYEVSDIERAKKRLVEVVGTKGQVNLWLAAAIIVMRK
ncbi:hypothetical protein MPSEU_000156800 [Mayamaea pseudoterrestris]|nr:hypothetical protein MPSEU_000156800 [Mayamaea pseudoterrestris]